MAPKSLLLALSALLFAVSSMGCTVPVHRAIEEPIDQQSVPDADTCHRDEDCTVLTMDSDCCDVCSPRITTVARAQELMDHCATHDRLMPCPHFACSIHVTPPACIDNRCVATRPEDFVTMEEPPADATPEETPFVEAPAPAPDPHDDYDPSEPPVRDNSCESASDCVVTNLSSECCPTCGGTVHSRRYYQQLQAYCSGTGRPDHCPALGCARVHAVASCVDGQCVATQHGDYIQRNRF